MKNYLLLLSLLVATQSFAQKKGKVDPKDLTIDSLKTVNDSLSKSLDKYYGVYTVVKEKVFKYEFDPANTAKLIDSLRAHRDSTFTLTLKDTVAILTKAYKKDEARIDSLTAVNGKLVFFIEQAKGTSIVPADVTVDKIVGNKPATTTDPATAPSVDKAVIIGELKQLKELLDIGVISQQEFDAKKAKLIEKL